MAIDKQNEDDYMGLRLILAPGKMLPKDSFREIS
jgi:hypothetical protein